MSSAFYYKLPLVCWNQFPLICFSSIFNSKCVHCSVQNGTFIFSLCNFLELLLDQTEIFESYCQVDVLKELFIKTSVLWKKKLTHKRALPFAEKLFSPSHKKKKKLIKKLIHCTISLIRNDRIVFFGNINEMINLKISHGIFLWFHSFFLYLFLD